MKIPVLLKWVEAENKWHLMTPNGSFLYDLYNCENMQKIFDNPDKTKVDMYIIDVHKFNGKLQK